MPRRLAVPLLSVVLAALAPALAACDTDAGDAPGTGGAPPADGITASQDADCPGADALPDGRGDPQFAAAVRCLINAERTARDLEPLRRDARLAEAAQVHSSDMAQRNYFAHTSPGGRDAGDRARAAGYTPQVGSTWRVGENIGYGSGPLGTPRRLMSGWMDSPGHREAILTPQFAEVGVGVARGRPGEGRPRGVIATTVFGDR